MSEKTVKETVGKGKNNMKRKLLIAAGVVCVSILMVWAGLNYGDADREASKSDEVAVDAFNKVLFEEYVPIDEAKALLENEIGGEDAAFMDNFVGGFLNRLEKRAEGLNSILRMFINEIDNATGGDIDKIKSMQTDDVILGALAEELNGDYFEVYGEELRYATVKVNYERIREEYGSLSSRDFNSKLELMALTNKYEFYDYINGHIDFENIYKRYEFIESMANREENEDGVYLTGEAYDTYGLLLGIYDMGTNMEDGTIKESVIEQMNKVAESAKDTGVAEDLRAVVALIQEENSYSINVEELAVSLIDARFKEYINSMQTEIGK